MTRNARVFQEVDVLLSARLSVLANVSRHRMKGQTLLKRSSKGKRQLALWPYQWVAVMAFAAISTQVSGDSVFYSHIDSLATVYTGRDLSQKWKFSGVLRLNEVQLQ